MGFLRLFIELLVLILSKLLSLLLDNVKNEIVNMIVGIISVNPKMIVSSTLITNSSAFSKSAIKTLNTQILAIKSIMMHPSKNQNLYRTSKYRA